MKTLVTGKESMNVLFVICDDLNDWVLHPEDHPQVKTPHIDRLRKLSVSFTNAHAAVPVCGPSRKCLFSGLYPQTIDSFDFDAWKRTPALKDCVPIPLHFRNNGYSVFGAGKLLHEGAGGDFYTEYGYGVDYGPHPWLGEGPAEHTPHPRQYDLWEGYLPRWDMHRDMNFGPLSDVPEWKAGRIEGKPGTRGWYYRDATPFRYVDDTNRDRMPDEISVDYACEVMRRKHERPFFIGVGLTKPHTPLYVPDEYFDRYPIDEVTFPPYLENDLDDCAEALRSRFAWGFQKFEALIAAGGKDGWRAFVQAYLATVSFVDDQIGRLMETLESEGHLDSTVIVFTSDNGYHLGEKDCIQKWHLWNESTRLPMMIHAPGMQGNGRDCNHPVSHIDLYPSLIDLCDLPPQPHRGSEYALDGHSLVPFLQAPENDSWHGPPVALVGIRGDLANMDKNQPPHFSVCSDRYRYTLCANGEEELYDHDKDPHEWTNLAQSAVHQETKAQLLQELMSILDNSKVPDNYRPNNSMQATPNGAPDGWRWEKGGNMRDAILLWPEQSSGACPETQVIDEKGHISCVSVPRLVPFLPPASEANGTSIVICPGGGYRLIDWIEHVERLAQCFNPKGVAVIGLQYRTTPPSHNMPEDAIADLRRALCIVLANASEWQIAPDRVVGLGFSAGANLLLRYACTNATSLDGDELHRSNLSLNHMALLCLWPHNKPADAYSISLDAPDAFLCATEEDETAPADFSRAIGEKLRKAGRDVTIKVYTKGNHLAFNFKELGPDIDWTPDFLAWLNDRGLLR